MDRGALIGGAAVIAALGGVVIFYFVLSSGSTGEIEEYDRHRPGVEKLRDVASSEARVARPQAQKGVKLRSDGMAEAMNMKRHNVAPEAAKSWSVKRAEAAKRDERMAGEQLEDFFKDNKWPEEKQKVLWTLFNDNFELRKNIRVEIEDGVTSPRVGRKRLSTQREQMKTDLLQEVSEAEYEQLQERMNKIRVVLF